jgi:SAM-dependent methyltransferase
LELRDRLLGIEGQFRVVRCARCDLHYLNPQPTMAELACYYPEDYQPFAVPPPDQMPLLQRLSVTYGLHKRRKAITRYKDGGSLLEIGCANGLFLNAMRRTGRWQLQGVDVSEPAVRYAQEQFGLDVFHGPLEDAKFPDQSFDAVVMWDVLEHVHQPKGTLLEIRRVLKPDGIFVFRLPLLGSYDEKLFGPYWAGWDAPRHLTSFSKDTLKAMLELTGFRVERMACISGGYPVFALSLRFWATDHFSKPAQKRLERLLEALPVRLIVAPVFYFIDQLRKSAVVTVSSRPDQRAALSRITED